MTRKTHDLTIPAGTYTDKNGQTKTKWETIGAMFETDNGRRFITIRRTFNPAGVALDDKGSNKENVIINMFDSNSRGY